MGVRDTSADAYDAIKPHADVLRARVALFIRNAGVKGATDEEVQHALAMNGNTQRPRRWELMNEGRVKNSGKVRPTQSNRNAVIWVYVGDPEEQEALRALAVLERKKAEVRKAIMELLKEMDLPKLTALLTQLGEE